VRAATTTTGPSVAALFDLQAGTGTATLANLVNYCQAHHARFVLVSPDTQLLATLRSYGTLADIGEGNIYRTVADCRSLADLT
jgi:hypothetical protein